MPRFIELILVLLILGIFLVPIVLIAVTMRASSRGPIIFWSCRVGRLGRTFEMPKFRTMRVGAPIVPTNDLENPNLHITPFGRFLRRTSLDELPQIYSVLKGDMCLVGPRPVLPSQSTLLERRKASGVDVLSPGITGWAQINGRDFLTTDEKVRLDVEYLQLRSLKFDLKILWLTVFYVLASKGVSH